MRERVMVERGGGGEREREKELNNREIGVGRERHSQRGVGDR